MKKFIFLCVMGFGLSTQAVEATPAPTPAHLALGEWGMDFGLLLLGQSSFYQLFVTNTGETTATKIKENGMTAPFGFAGGKYPGTGGNCGETLDAKAYCLLVIEFTPTALEFVGQVITLEYFNGTADAHINALVQGSGVTTALIEGVTSDFGKVKKGATVTMEIILANNGGSVAVDMSAALPTPFAFVGGTYPGTDGTCGYLLNPGDFCTVVVSFTPTSVKKYDGVLKLHYKDGAGDVFSETHLLGKGN